MDTFTHDINGPSNTLDAIWHSNTAKFGWLVEGIFPSGVDATHINSVEISKVGDLVVTGDDNGVVNIFRNPVRLGHKPISLRGHGDSVTKVKFNQSESHLLSLGGYDKTLIQWKRVE